MIVPDHDAQGQLPVPGPSFVREETITVSGPVGGPGRQLTAGMALPSVMDDGWWLTHLWVADEGGVVQAIDVAPVGGPPPGTPLGVLGPRVAGALSGLIDQEDGRQLIRLRMPPPANESRPWERPLVCMLAIRWDPVRASVMQRNQLARELLRAFAAAVEGLGRPG